MGMDSEKVMELLLSGMISKMPEEEQKKTRECAEKIRAVVKEYGDCGTIALTLLSLEISEN